MSKVTALGKVYNMYKANENNPHICSNLADLCIICISEYVATNSPERKKVESMLNNILNNRSDMFESNAPKFLKGKQEILSELPTEVRNLLSGRIVTFGYSLTDNGLALKSAISYLDKFGTVREKDLHAKFDLRSRR